MDKINRHEKIKRATALQQSRSRLDPFQMSQAGSGNIEVSQGKKPFRSPTNNSGQ